MNQVTQSKWNSLIKKQSEHHQIVSFAGWFLCEKKL